jgi:hypothetical protein
LYKDNQQFGITYYNCGFEDVETQDIASQLQEIVAFIGTKPIGDCIGDSISTLWQPTIVGCHSVAIESPIQSPL